MTNPWIKRTKCTNKYEEWRLDEHNGTWCEYRIFEYNDGSATSKVITGPLTENEYFKRKLDGRAS